MIPLKDDTPRLSTPLLNYCLIVVNVVVFGFQCSLSRAERIQFIDAFSLVPARLTAVLPEALPHVHSHGNLISPHIAPLATVLTSMFIHGSAWHLMCNVWFLFIFGRKLEETLGHFSYVLFYLTCGFAAALAQILSNSVSVVPIIGASGAIAGVMGGYFILYPRARVLMLVPFFFFFFLWLPAWAVLGYWFVLQFLNGVGTALLAPERNSGGIALWAHVGGFMTGALLVRLFPVQARRYSSGK
ncbi:MAG: rhomboid family intramembrane serine protease [Acidobacteria bacterium]|nr:MAG: rhomboid family intramembrane serine protease [Acidobacteriota bacterium]